MSARANDASSRPWAAFAANFDRWRGSLLAVLVLSGLISVLSASSASALVIGSGWSGAGDRNSSEMLEVAKSGSQVFRVPINNDWAGDDALMEAAALNGVTIHAGLGGGGPLPGAGGMAEWLSWVSTAVQKYGYGGSFWKEHPSLPSKPITAWEIWNEPDLFGNTGAEFGQFVSENANTIQAASNSTGGRGTEVISGGLNVWGNKNGYEEDIKYMEAAYPKFATNPNVTGVAIHPYELDPSTFFSSGYTRLEAFKFAVAGFHYKLVELASAAKSPQKPLWITEAGWPAEGPQYAVGATEQANLLKQSIDYAKNNQATLNLGGYIWYNYRDRTSTATWDDYCGLRDHVGNYRPSWIAFQEETGAAAWPAPSVNTGDALELKDTEVTLTGTVDPHARSTSFHFEYGATTSYGSTIPVPDENAGSGNGSVVVSKHVTGLLPRMHYHYRLVATSGAGTIYGNDRTFTTGLKWSLRNSNSAGAADSIYWFGGPGETSVSGDWDGNGTTTPGSYDPSTGTWKLTNGTSGGVAEIEFGYGGSPGLPVTGDWDGNGTTTIGIYYPSTGNWNLRNSNSAGGADISFGYGGSPALPVTGDWNNDGTTTIGTYYPSTGNWNLRNTNNAGGADISFQYGGSQFQPVTGDWDGNGTTTIGLFESQSGSWQLRNVNSSGSPEVSFSYAAGGSAITGDWDGNGTTTAGVADNNATVERRWLQRNSNTPGTPEASFYFGLAGESAVTGDWDGDGVVTPGVYLPATGTWKLTNSKTGGPAETEIQYGSSAGLPVTGDWDNNGTTTIGIYYPSSGIWDLRNSNSPGGAEISFGYGGSPALPVTGDWDNNGTTTIGTYYPSTGNWNLRNTNSAGGADISFGYGGSPALPVTGDWDGNGTTTIGTYYPSTGNWNLRNTNSAGGADISFQYGDSQFQPVTGDWDGNGTFTPALVAAGADPSLPGVRTDAAGSVQESQATLNGLVEPMGYATTYYYEYGTTTAYDAIAPVPVASTQASVRTSVNATIAQVQPGTVYHYRLVAKNALGTSYGQDRTVTFTGYQYVTGPSTGTAISGWSTALGQGLPQESVSADFNGDGKADLINAESEGSSGYRLRVGFSSGTAISSWSTARTGIPSPERLAAGDFTGDGKADVVSVESEGNGKYRYMLGASNGTTISSWTSIATGKSLPSRMVLGDFTGDKKADILSVESEGNGSYRYVLGTSTGTGISGWSNIKTGAEYPYKTSIGDFTGDGKADIVSVEASTGTNYRYMLGTSNGTGLTGWSEILSGMSFPYKTALGDFNADGKADIVSLEFESGSNYRYMLGVSKGTGTSSWSSIATGVNLHGKMNLADFNGDGKADVVAISSDGKGAFTHKIGLSNGSGISSWETVQTWMNKPSSVKTGDFNGDGKADIVSAEPESSGNYRYRVGFSAGASGISSWKTVIGGMTPPSWLGVADVNADGKADIIALEPEGNGKYRYMFGISNGTGIASWNNAIGGMSPVSWMRVGDVNGDKKADVVAVEEESNNKYRFMFGLSGGTNISSWFQALGGLGPADKFAVGDFTGDGKADVVSVESEGGSNYRYMLGVSSGSGISSWSKVLGSMSHPSFMDLGDVNGDKKADIVAVEPEGSNDRYMYGISAGTTVSSWLTAKTGATQSTLFAEGDLDGDGKSDAVRLANVP